MSNTTFVDKSLPLIEASWLNEVNDHLYGDVLVGGRTHLHEAVNLGFIPDASIAATNIQDAIVELAGDLRAEKANVGANTDITSLANLPLAIATPGTTQASALVALGAALCTTAAKTTDFTVPHATDRGYMYFCTNAITVTLPTVANAGNGFIIGVHNGNVGTTNVIVDPNGATIDAIVSNIIISPQETCLFMCNGSRWISINRDNILQNRMVQSSTVQTTTAIIPIDGTVPQISEGLAWINTTIVPKVVNSWLEVDVIVYLKCSIGTTLVVALFDSVESATDAVGASVVTVVANEIKAVQLKRYYQNLDGLTPRNISVNVGPGAASTLTVNTALVGTVTVSSRRVTEHRNIR